MKDNPILAGVIMVLIFAAGISLGYYFGGDDTRFTNDNLMSDETTEAEAVSEENTGEVTASVPEEGIQVDANTLTDGQKAVLRTLGVDTKNMVITAEMVACAEAKVGSERLMEIQNGDSPTMLEGASLAACYK